MYTFNRSHRVTPLCTLSLVGISALLSWIIATHRITAVTGGYSDRTSREIVLASGAGLQDHAGRDTRHYVFSKVLEGEHEAVLFTYREHVRRTGDRGARLDPRVWQDECILALAAIGIEAINPDNDLHVAIVITAATSFAAGPMLHEVATWYAFKSAGSFERRLSVARNWVASLPHFVPGRLDDPPAYYRYLPNKGTYEDAVLAMYSKVIGGYERGLGGDEVVEALRDVWSRYYDTVEHRDDGPTSETELVNAQFAFLDRQVRMHWDMR